MTTVRTFGLAGALLALSLAGCDDDPLAPDAPRFAAGGGRTVLAPSNLTATALSSSQVDVAWQDNSDNEGGFEVWVAVTGASSFTLWTTTGPNVTKTSFTGISGEQEYCAEARAFTLLGKSGKIASYSAFSNVACTSTALPPSAPLNANATPLSSSSASVAWFDNSNNEDGFRIERSLDSLTWTVAGSTQNPVTSFQDSGLPSEQRLCYRVIAFNSHGDSPPATDCTALPAGPTALTASGTATPAIDLEWTDNSKVEDGYEVLRSGDGYNFGVLASLPPNSTTYHDGAVFGNARYWYAVQAKKDLGNSDRSNTVSALAATSLPNAPSGTDATAVGSTIIQIVWMDNSSNEDGFRVERSLDGGASWALAGTTGAYNYWQGWFPDADRTPDQLLCYRVLAFNSLGVSAPSNTDCVTPVAAPTNLVATTAASGPAIDLTWTDNSQVEDGYEVRRQFTYCGEYDCYYDYASIATLGPNTTSYQDPALSPGEYNTYIVVAFKDGSYSDASNEASAFSTLPPPAPSNLTATTASAGQIDLAWTLSSTGDVSVAVERCEGDAVICADPAAAWMFVTWTAFNATTYSDTGLLSGTTYTYRVVACDPGGCSGPSNLATAIAP